MHQELLWETSLYGFLWLFLIYAFLGWCAEVAAHAVTMKKFVNRGFLNGPYCPIYGFGMVLVVVCLTPISDNLVLLFIGSVILTTFLEFITGFVLEKVFHTRWWDYTNQKLNIGGYICLKYSILWGIACVVIMKIVEPLIVDLINLIPQLFGQILILIFLAGMIADLITVIITLSGMSKRMKQAAVIMERIQEHSDKIGVKITDGVLEIQDKLDKLPEKKNIIQKRLERSYPRLANLDMNISKEDLKNILKEKTEKLLKK